MNKSTKFYDSWPKNIAHRTPIKQPVKHELTEPFYCRVADGARCAQEHYNTRS